MDCRYLSVVLSRSCRCLAGRRPCAARGGAPAVAAGRAPDRAGDGAAGRNMAALARSRSLCAMGLLWRVETARCRRHPNQRQAGNWQIQKGDARWGNVMAAETDGPNLDGPRLEPRDGGAARQLVVFLHG